MPTRNFAIKIACKILLCVALISLLAPPNAAQTPSSNQGQTDVVRIFTELVQTDVMVFDKQGQKVKTLKREDFQLKIDGKPRTIEFFEHVTAGSDEDAQLAAARGNQFPVNPTRKVVPLDRGRSVFFYVDDLHLDPPGLKTIKDLINRFLDEEMGQNDEAAITSATGQIGFLQQLTDNRVVLRKALEKIKHRPYNVRDFESPRMTEYQALLIENGDLEVNQYFITETIRGNPGLTLEAAANMVRARARTLLQTASHITLGTLAGLESLIRTVNRLPGRKLVFFISNGFFLDHRNSDILERLRRISSAAARSGVIIYSMDARGLVTGITDISETTFDPSGQLARSTHGELLASQDGMHSLAHATGGRSFFSTNDFKPGLSSALKETSFYYLLAWRPDQTKPGSTRFRKIEVSVPGRSDLTVRVRRGFFDVEPTEPTVNKKERKASPPAATREHQLVDALTAPYPDTRLPLSLALTYLDTAVEGSRLSASVQIPAEFITFKLQDGEYRAALHIIGSFYNELGQRGNSFNNKIDVTSSAQDFQEGNRQDISYTYPILLGPGLYQVRVAVMDEHSGRLGSQSDWIEIPDLTKNKLEMSSLLLGERVPNELASMSKNAQPVSDAVGLSVSKRFHRDSHLRFLVFVYNAATNGVDKKPDVALQVQIVRDKQPVVTTTLKKILSEGVNDLKRLPYAAEIPLNELSAGSYRLQVTVIDRVAKLSASQQTRFEVY